MAAFTPYETGGRIALVLTDDNDTLLGYADTSRPGQDDPDRYEWMMHGLIRQGLTSLLR
ncbi:MAG: hypothetical protein ACKVIQ_17080 [Acidimicrobiales bacterium]|jgi:hypothetical protein